MNIKERLKKIVSEINEVYGGEDETFEDSPSGKSNVLPPQSQADSLLPSKPPIDLFGHKQDKTWNTGTLVGQPFRLSYKSADVLLFDDFKKDACGIPQGTFLLAYYNGANECADFEAILLRVIEPTPLPQDQDKITSMIECYQDSCLQLDPVTRYYYSQNGMKCSILGSFYLSNEGKMQFGADLENFYSSHNYSVVKPLPRALEFIVNYRGYNVGIENEIKIGKVRYSSSQRFQSKEAEVPVYVRPQDFAGKRTALFGMTRTGKSNTMKKIIQATVRMSDKATCELDNDDSDTKNLLNQFDKNRNPIYPIGQIIFDPNGEYANANRQDGGTAIFDLFKEKTVRYSTVEKSDYKVMKVNFYKEIDEGFALINAHPQIADSKVNYVINFRTISLMRPENYDSDHSESTRYDRRIAVYQCCLFKAGFGVPNGFIVRFRASKEVCNAVNPKIILDDDGFIILGLEEAANWWKRLWEIYDDNEVFKEYFKENMHEWADDDLKILLIVLTGKSSSKNKSKWSGYNILRDIRKQHTSFDQNPFDEDILRQLRSGKIVIIDLSSGDEELRQMFSIRITKKIFDDALRRFTEAKQNNFIQFYFEEAHNLFPKKDDTDLLQIYNRLAKEGAKLGLGITYATQEVSSISSNILKNTENWFISHLNNQDEINELKKYHDFGDVTENLIKFSQDTDKGFVRMKTSSNAFVVPVQIDEFKPEDDISGQKGI